MNKTAVVAVCAAILIGAAVAMSGHAAPAAGIAAGVLVICLRGARLNRKSNSNSNN